MSICVVPCSMKRIGRTSLGVFDSLGRVFACGKLGLLPLTVSVVQSCNWAAQNGTRLVSTHGCIPFAIQMDGSLSAFPGG